MNQSPDLTLFLGHFHPMLLHLPIGMIVILATLEIIAWVPKFQRANVSAGFILAVATPLAAVTALLGWLLSHEGGYDARLIFWHQWLGFATAAGCALTAIFYRLRNRVAYHASLFSTAAVMSVAGHLGGSLTHGSDYLTEHAPSFVKKILGDETKIAPASGTASDSAFAQLVQPVLKEYCVNCHGPEKAKGGLRLDSYAAVMKGGEHGPVVLASDAEKSILLKVLALPAEHDDHMPPDGKPQPSADDLALLKWWIAAGASETKTSAELQLPAEFLNRVNVGKH